MGLLSNIFGGGGSKTKSTATQATTNTDQSVGGSSGIIATGGSTINYLDKNVAMEALDTASELGRAGIGASGYFVQAATDLGRASFESSDKLANNAVALGQSSFRASQGLADSAVKINADNATVTENSRIGNNNLARDLAYNAIEKVQALAQPADVQAANVTGKYIVYLAAAAAAVAVAFFAFRKK